MCSHTQLSLVFLFHVLMFSNQSHVRPIPIVKPGRFLISGRNMGKFRCERRSHLVSSTFSPNISLRITLFNIYCDFYFLLFGFLFFIVIFIFYYVTLRPRNKTSKTYLDNDKYKFQRTP